MSDSRSSGRLGVRHDGGRDPARPRPLLPGRAEPRPPVRRLVRHRRPTTGIYCRPSCPAVTPKRATSSSSRPAAAAQQRGFRACKRCRPDASPGSPEWNVRGDVVARAMRLIADGVVDREGVGGLAAPARLQRAPPHAARHRRARRRPLAIARAQRAQTARMLIETTDDVDHRHRVRRRVRQRPPVQRHRPRGVRARRRRELRAARRRRLARRSPERCRRARPAVREPFAGRSISAFLGARAVPGVEAWDGERYHRTLDLPHGHGVAVLAERAASDVRCRAAARRLARPRPGRAARPPAARPRRRPGRRRRRARRRPGARAARRQDARAARARQRRPVRDGRAGVVGQQISVAGARTVAGRIVAAVGDPLTIAGDRLTHVFPSPAALAALDPDALPMPRARGRTLVGAGRGRRRRHDRARRRRRPRRRRQRWSPCPASARGPPATC